VLLPFQHLTEAANLKLEVAKSGEVVERAILRDPWAAKILVEPAWAPDNLLLRTKILKKEAA